MDRSNFARNHSPDRSYPIPSGRPTSKSIASVPASVRASSEHAWANANRAWKIACRLAALRR
jgi:hypothetical protein